MDLHIVLLTLGALLLVGLATDEIGRRTRLPRVTLLVVFGMAAGSSGFDLLPSAVQDWYEFLAKTALTMVAFLLGGTLSVATLRSHGRDILIISASVVLVTAVIVGLGLTAIGASLTMALLLAGIATATAPAATQDVVRQTCATGPFAETLLGIVAIDDAWGLIVFSLLLMTAKAVAGDGAAEVLAQGLWEIGGAAAVGAAVGLPAAYLSGRLRPGEPTQTEALGLVFLCAGLASWLEVSFLLAAMVAGFIVVNLARHHRRAFHEIEHIEWPFMVLFFVLAGAALQLGDLRAIGFVGAAYIVLRSAGRVFGGWLGGRLAGAPAAYSRWIGVALIPQAGVALGMALVAGSHFPELKETLLALTVGSTVVFEIVGPILTQTALRKASDDAPAPASKT